MTKVVNFFAGPGTGKSTTTAATFAKLKMAGRNVEIAHEFAKDLTWEDRSKALRFQPYITGKQMFKVHRLLGEVEAVLTDSPILLSMVYADETMPASYFQFIGDIFSSWDTINIVLFRSPERPYNPKGRRQTEDEARSLDREIFKVVKDWCPVFWTVQMGDTAADECFDIIQAGL